MALILHTIIYNRKEADMYYLYKIQIITKYLKLKELAELQKYLAKCNERSDVEYLVTDKPLDIS